MISTYVGVPTGMPLHPSLAAHLRKTPPTSRLGPVMPSMTAAQPRAISNNFRRMILPRIGIDQAYGPGGPAGRKLAEHSLHSLRHSLATWLNAAGVPEMMRMRLIGHEDQKVSRGYTHTQLGQAAAELAKVRAV